MNIVACATKKSNLILFDDVLAKAVNFVTTHQDVLGGFDSTVIVRDIFGRCSLALNITPTQEHLEKLKTLECQFKEILGSFAFSEFLYVTEMFAADAVFKSKNVKIFEDSNVKVLNRQITCEEWGILSKALNDELEVKHPPRVIFHSNKGGIGRSTALSLFAKDLALQGKKVLVVDLCFESPGIYDVLPYDFDKLHFGSLDWFVESALNKEFRVTPNFLSSYKDLELWNCNIRIVPIVNPSESYYVEKLSRLFVNVVTPNGRIDFADRLESFILQLEQQENPDIVLLDCPVGINDIAAAAMSRLDAMTLFFIQNNSQSLDSYLHLFEYWKRWNINPKSIRTVSIVKSAQDYQECSLYLKHFEQFKNSTIQFAPEFFDRPFHHYREILLKYRAEYELRHSIYKSLFDEIQDELFN